MSPRNEQEDLMQQHFVPNTKSFARVEQWRHEVPTGCSASIPGSVRLGNSQETPSVYCYSTVPEDDERDEEQERTKMLNRALLRATRRRASVHTINEPLLSSLHCHRSTSTSKTHE